MSRFANSRRRGIAVGIALITFAAVALSACGGSSSKPESSSGNPEADKLQVAVASYDLNTGPERRFIVGLLTGDNRTIGWGTVNVAIYRSDRGPTAAQTAEFLPIPDTVAPTPLPTKPTVTDGAHGRGVYESTVEFDSPGIWSVTVSADIDGLGAQEATSEFAVGNKPGVVAKGAPAPKTKNPTATNHGKLPLSALDSRAQGTSLPDAQLHEMSIADALAAHRRTVVVFSTPVYCQSRFCGPITDVIEQMATDDPDTTYIHVEIYQDFEKGLVNEAAFDWLSRNGGDVTEPWVFVIDSKGVVTERFDNVVTEDELEQAVAAAQ